VTTTPSSFESLVEDHLDGELTPERFDELCNDLRGNEQNMLQFGRAWLIHSLLCNLVNQECVHANTLAEVIAAKDDGAGFHRPAGIHRRLRLAVLGISAVLLVAATVGTLVYRSMPPTTVAMLTQTANCRWDGAAPVDGALLKMGQTLHLLDGHALLTFTSGARVVIEGPSQLVLETPGSMMLSGGALTARVPSHAVGFTVNMPLGKIVDLGTEFSLRVRADHSCGVQIFRGMVELRLLDKTGKLDESPLRLPEGVGVKVDAKGGQAESVTYDESQRIVMP
jgi:ferric-dicitrate binding protein FerR (iron transport regulator)